MWLKYCWKGRKTASHPSIHPHLLFRAGLFFFIPRPKGSGDVVMSLASVRVLVRKHFSCRLCNLNTVRNILMILHCYIEQVMTMCGIQKWELSLKHFLCYLPFDAFYAYSCPLCNLNTLWNMIMILHSYEEQVMTMCRVQEDSSRSHTLWVISPWWFQVQFCVRSLTISRPRGWGDIAMSLASVLVRTDVRKHFRVRSVIWIPFWMFWWYFTVI